MRQLLLAAPARGVVLRVCVCDTEPSQLRRALPSVEHFVSCHPDSVLQQYSRILYVIDEYRIGV